MLLTVEDLRLRVETTLDEEALQSLLDAAESAITARFGSVDETQEYLRASGDLLILSRRADAITTIIEGTTTLDEDDYELRADGQTLRRLSTGTNPSHRWRGRIDLTYVPADDVAERERVQAALVELDIGFSPAVRRERIGDWEEEQQAGSVAGLSYADIRASILDSLGMSVVLL